MISVDLNTMTIVPFLIGAFALVTGILWLVIGWRAMKAHESLARNAGLIREELKRIAADSASRGKIL